MRAPDSAELDSLRLLLKTVCGVAVKDWIAAMPDICQVFFNDDISIDELKENIDDNAKTYTDSVFKYADKDEDNSITKLEWIRFFHSGAVPRDHH